MVLGVWDNILQILMAMVALVLFYAPVGVGLSRQVGIAGGWGTKAVLGAIWGMAILALVYNVVGMIIRQPLFPSGRLIIWILLLAGMWLLPRTARFQKQYRAPMAVWLVALLAGMITLLPLMQHNAQLHQGDIRRVAMFDWAKHLTIASAFLLDDTLPPRNPYLWLEADLRYYYFAYMLPAFIVQLTAGTLQLANCLSAQAILSALAFPILIYHYARDLSWTPSAGIVSASLATLVGGWDILYIWQLRLTTGAWPSGFAGAWVSHSDRSIRQMAELFLWTPQHVLGVLIAISIFWYISRLTRGCSSPAVTSVALALFVAALAGVSAFVWVACLLGIGAFLLVECFFVRFNPTFCRVLSFRVLSSVFVALVSGILFVAPYLYVIGGRDEPAFILEISRTRGGIFYGGIFGQIFGESYWTYALDFPFQMLPEFGTVLFTGLAGWFVMRRRWRVWVEGRFWAAYLPILFFIILAIRPGRTYSNEYAAYSAPIAWVILALLSGAWWMHRRQSWLWRPVGKVFITLGIFLGLAGAFYEPFIQLSAPQTTLASDYNLYHWLNTRFAEDDVYQINEHKGEEPQYFVRRWSAFLDPFTSPIYTGEELTIAIARTAVDIGKSVPYPSEAHRAYQQAGVNGVIVRADTALASENHPLFGAYFQLVFQNNHYRVYTLRALP